MPLTNIQFEIERRVILFTPKTSMPDATQLGFNGDPNTITMPNTPGEQLIFFSPVATRYAQMDMALDNVVQEWAKKTLPNGWVPLGGGDIGASGTDSSTWQLNQQNEGVVLKDVDGNLVVTTYDGSLGTLTIGGLKIGNLTGYLRAIDGSVYADNIDTLKTFSYMIIGDGTTKSFIVEHSLNTLNHVLSVYEMSGNVIYPEISIGLNLDNVIFSSPVQIGTDYRIVILGF
jgi:hypothetical protein